MPRRGRRRKKTRTHVVEVDERVRGALRSQDELRVPRSLVVRRGRTEPELAELVADIRAMMRPHTALNFKEDARNRKMTLARYAESLCSSMGVTHILALSQNGPKITLRVGRAPGGPTLSFRVKRFTLGAHVRSVQRRPVDPSGVLDGPPVVVTNNFGDATAPPHVKLMRITFQNMFPAIDVGTVKLAECRRVALFNFIRRDVSENSKPSPGGDDDLEDEEVEVRHYAIRARPVGVDRKVRRIVESKVPDLSRVADIADYITGDAPGGDASDSEPEDETSHVVLPSRYRGKGNNPSQKSALKLVEMGPRLRLKLYKVERGLASGDVMYHAYVTKTPQEVMELKERKEGERKLKKRRREEQEANVARKKEAKEEKREARERRKREREERAMAALRGEAPEDDDDEDGGSNGGSGRSSDDDDDGSDGEDDAVEEGSKEDLGSGGEEEERSSVEEGSKEESGSGVEEEERSSSGEEE